MTFTYTAFDVTQYVFFIIKLLCIVLFNHSMYIYSQLFGTKQDYYTLACFILVEFALLADIILRSIGLFGILL